MVSSAVLGVVLFTMVVFGSFMPLLKVLFSDVLMSKESINTDLQSPLALTSPMLPQQRGVVKRSFLHHTWRHFDKHVIKKYLITKEALIERAKRENRSIDLSTL